MNSNQVAALARIVFALCMLVFAFFHLSNASGMAGGVPSFMPGPGAMWIYITGVGLALAGIAFLINQKVRLAGYLLGTMLLIFVLTIHLPHVIGGDQSAMGMLLKDTGLAAAAFFIGSKS